MTDTTEVDIKSAWLSKINWTQVVSVVASLLVVFGLDIPPETQAHIATAITALTGLVTIVMKTFFTTSITPSSAANT